jgi:hypothetical protein
MNDSTSPFGLTTQSSIEQVYRRGCEQAIAMLRQDVESGILTLDMTTLRSYENILHKMRHDSSRPYTCRYLAVALNELAEQEGV